VLPPSEGFFRSFPSTFWKLPLYWAPRWARPIKLCINPPTGHPPFFPPYSLFPPPHPPFPPPNWDNVSHRYGQTGYEYPNIIRPREIGYPFPPPLLQGYFCPQWIRFGFFLSPTSGLKQFLIHQIRFPRVVTTSVFHPTPFYRFLRPDTTLAIFTYTQYFQSHSPVSVDRPPFFPPSPFPPFLGILQPVFSPPSGNPPSFNPDSKIPWAPPPSRVPQVTHAPLYIPQQRVFSG